MNSHRNIGIIGFGAFGQFLARHLSPHAEVRAYDPHPDLKNLTSDLKTVCASDLIIFAVPFKSLEEAAKSAQPYISPTTPLTDVTSVKVRPLQILQEYFPHNPLLGTHPIFGPQSGKGGITGLPIVLSNISWGSDEYAAAKTFLTDTLKIRVIEKTPEEHDREMAHVQGLAHFLGRALKDMDIKDYETNTFSYHQLVELRDLLKDDSWELFETIQNANPHASDVRTKLMSTLQALEKQLRDDAGPQ